MSLLRLIRLPNLIIVALTQCLLYFRILLPEFQEVNLSPALDLFHFSLFVGVTLIITACGYIINDILDREIDALNKPNRLIVGPKIKVQAAGWLYAVGGLIGFFIALYLGMKENRAYLIGIYPLAFLLLYWYSVDLKKRPLWGNLLIAIFCAGVTAAIWLAEGRSLQELTHQSPLAFYRIRILFIFYLLFAFLSTLFRELVKDLEDMEGDRTHGCHTVPIDWGVAWAKRLAVGAAVFLFLSLVYQLIAFGHFFNRGFLVFAILGILLPLVVGVQRLITARDSKAYRIVSHLAKLIILNGVLLLFFASL